MLPRRASSSSNPPLPLLQIPHDALLLLDRAMSTSLMMMMRDNLLPVAAQASLLICLRQAPLTLLPPDARPTDLDVSAVTGVGRVMCSTSN